MTSRATAGRAQHHSLTSRPAVLLVPPHPLLAPTHDFPKLRPFNFAYTGVFNVMELPVTSAPLGASPSPPLPPPRTS
jgi:fatty acid amide hydrolase 2